VADVLLASARDLIKPDLDTPLLEAALAARGVDVRTAPWDDETAGWDGAALVAIRSTWDYFDRRPEFVDWVDQVAAATRLVNPADVVRWNSAKTYLADLGAKGVPILPTAFLSHGADADLQAEALAGFDAEVVVKPAVGGGARGALRAPAGSPEAAAHVADLVTTGDVLVQPYEPTVAVGEDSLIFLGGVFSHAVRKVPAAGDYRVQEQYGGTVAPIEPTYLQEQVAAAVLAAVPAQLAYARVDLVRPGEPALMELEVIEPELFLRLDPPSAGRLADHLVGLLG